MLRLGTVCGTLVSLVLVAGAQASILPAQPIAHTKSALCGEGRPSEPFDDCDFIRRTGEPSVPITNFGETRASFRVVWRDALYDTVVVRVEIFSDDRAELHAYGYPTRSDEYPVPFAVHTGLRPGEINTVLATVEHGGFWNLAQTHEPQSVKLPDGREVINFCTDEGLISIEGYIGSRAHSVVRGDCDLDGSDAAILVITRTMIRIAKLHFPDLPTYYFLPHKQH